MKSTTVLLLLAFSALALAQSKPGTVAPAESSFEPSPETPASKNTTTAPTTTKSTTTTTTKPTTTTTTTKPTTKSTPKTTPKPTPKPTTKPTTTIPPPTTKPPGKTTSTVGNYTLENGAQRCVMVQMEVQIRLDSAKKSFLLLPNQTSTGGECSATHATLILSTPNIINLTMEFTTDKNKTIVTRLAFNLTYDFGTNTSLAVNKVMSYKADNKTALFNASAGKSYSCRKESLFMGHGLHLDISQDRMQAFNFSKSNEFGTNEPCPADQNNYRVAVAVGITLLVLVVVVVVAYLLARKRRSDGYQSL